MAQEFVRPYYRFPRITQSGSRMYSKVGVGLSQDTIERGGSSGDAGMWSEPRLRRM